VQLLALPAVAVARDGYVGVVVDGDAGAVGNERDRGERQNGAKDQTLAGCEHVFPWRKLLRLFVLFLRVPWRPLTDPSKATAIYTDASSGVERIRRLP
jgi:hypothetical protein